MATVKERLLTKNQIGFLKSAADFGGWAEKGPGSGWIWDTMSNTKRICDLLTGRGYFEKQATTIWNVDRYADRYILTDKAKAAIAAATAPAVQETAPTAESKTKSGPNL
jgi:hypothetical protein